MWKKLKLEQFMSEKRYVPLMEEKKTFIIRPFSQLNHFREITLAVRFLY